jgi:hypothetical protein
MSTILEKLKNLSTPIVFLDFQNKLWEFELSEEPKVT